MKDLFVKTPAYKILAADKREGNLSHAYLLICDDAELLSEYLVDAAKLIACKEEDYCDECRVCRLIGSRSHPDVGFYPKDGAKKPLVSDADEVVAESVVKPYEIDKRLFVIDKFEELLQNQNKLLKTLEEPPKNVILLLGAQKESAILPTVRSRVRKLIAPPLGDKELLAEFGSVFTDAKRAAAAAVLSGGSLGKMRNVYADEAQFALFDKVLDFLSSAGSAKDLPRFVAAFSSYQTADVIACFKACLFEILKNKCGNRSVIDDIRLDAAVENYKEGAIASIIEKLSDMERSAIFNGNRTMLLDGVLFAVMEEKARWQRL